MFVEGREGSYEYYKLNESGIAVIGGCEQDDISFHLHAVPNDELYEIHMGVQLKDEFNPVVSDLRLFEGDNDGHDGEAAAVAMDLLNDDNSGSEGDSDGDGDGDGEGGDGIHCAYGAESTFKLNLIFHASVTAPNAIQGDKVTFCRRFCSNLFPALLIYLSKKEGRRLNILNKFINNRITCIVSNTQQLLFKVMSRRDPFAFIKSYLTYNDCKNMNHCNKYYKNKFNVHVLRSKFENFRYNHLYYKPKVTGVLSKGKFKNNNKSRWQFTVAFKNYCLARICLNPNSDGWVDFVINEEFYPFYSDKSTIPGRLDRAQLKIFRAMWRRWANKNLNNAISILSIANPLAFRLPGAGRKEALKRSLQWQIYRNAIDYALEHGALDVHVLGSIMFDVVDSASQCDLEPILWLGTGKIPPDDVNNSKKYYITEEKVARFRCDWNLNCIGANKSTGDVNKFIDDMIPVWMEGMVISRLIKQELSYFFCVCDIAWVNVCRCVSFCYCRHDLNTDQSGVAKDASGRRLFAPASVSGVSGKKHRQGYKELMTVKPVADVRLRDTFANSSATVGGLAAIIPTGAEDGLTSKRRENDLKKVGFHRLNDRTRNLLIQSSKNGWDNPSLVKDQINYLYPIKSMLSHDAWYGHESYQGFKLECLRRLIYPCMYLHCSFWCIQSIKKTMCGFFVF